METVTNWEFPLSQDVEFLKKLETKRKEYLGRINEPDPETHWSSWAHCDLICRHDMDPGFRFLYYKFVILCAVVMASNKKVEIGKTLGRDPYPDILESRMILIDLTESFGRPSYPLDVETFQAACKVLKDYLTGNEPL